MIKPISEFINENFDPNADYSYGSLTNIQVKMAYLLAEGYPIKDCHEALQVPQRTAWNWRKRDKQFQDFYYSILDNSLNKIRENHLQYMESAFEAISNTVSAKKYSKNFDYKIEQAKLANMLIDKVHQNINALNILREYREAREAEDNGC